MRTVFRRRRRIVPLALAIQLDLTKLHSNLTYIYEWKSFIQLQSKAPARLCDWSALVKSQNCSESWTRIERDCTNRQPSRLHAILDFASPIVSAVFKVPPRRKAQLRSAFRRAEKTRQASHENKKRKSN